MAVVKVHFRMRCYYKKKTKNSGHGVDYFPVIACHVGFYC